MQPPMENSRTPTLQELQTQEFEANKDLQVLRRRTANVSAALGSSSKLTSCACVINMGGYVIISCHQRRADADTNTHIRSGNKAAVDGRIRSEAML